MSKIGTIDATNKTIKKHDFHIKKKFGQNFLTDQNILRNITNIAEINKDTLVVEIGPGLGSMTELLLQKAKKVLAYEIDKDLIPILTLRCGKIRGTLVFLCIHIMIQDLAVICRCRLLFL